MVATKIKSPKTLIKKTIEQEVFVNAKDERIVSRGGNINTDGWLFDFRRVLMRADILDAVATLFVDTFKKKYPFQVGTLEIAGVPLMTGIVSKLFQTNHKDANGFFIRKSRKKDGLMRMVEGEIIKDRPIILVDDIINSGKSFMRQIEVLEGSGHKVDSVWAILRFKDEKYYTYFKDKGIKVYSLFTLDDFAKVLGTKNMKPTKHTKPRMPFSIQWKFESENPNYAYVVPKSDPVIDDSALYVGSDQGVFWALDQKSGKTLWSRKIGFHPKGKGIFSSPALADNTVYFGGYDGNVYALDTASGKPRWVFFDADWVGSSPTVAEDLGLVFIGLEFGLIKKRGGIVAIDTDTGKKVWDYQMPCYTHSSPLYIKEKRQVVIGSNDGIVYLFDAKNGTLVWEYSTGEINEDERMRGFSKHDIKESFAYDAERDYILFGTAAGTLFVLNRKTGEEVAKFSADFGFYSTPVIYKDTVLATSLDKHLYCFDLNTLKEKWRWHAGARIFATPIVINDRIYIGANTGRLTEIDPKAGKVLGFITVTERITNKIAWNPNTKRFFLPTFANEIYCLEYNDE